MAAAAAAAAVPGPPAPAHSLLHLPDDALGCILSRLDWLDLLASSASCRRLRAVAAPDSALWANICRRRWHGQLNTRLCAPPAGAVGAGRAAAEAATAGRGQQQPADYRSLFLHDNGWHEPALLLQQFAGGSWEDELLAVQPAARAADGSTLVAVSSCGALRLLQLGPEPAARLQVRHEARLGRGGGGELWSAVAALRRQGAGGTEGLVAAGGCHGRLALWRLPEHGPSLPEATSEAQLKPAAVLSFPDNSCVVTQLHHLPLSQRLASLHDSLAVLHPPQLHSGHSMLSVVDAASWRQVATGLCDVLDGYELAAVAPLGPAGCQYVAGSVKLSEDQASGWDCQRCSSVMPAALCFHKSPASAAALCMFDCREPRGLTARYATHHRSLYPHIQTVRDHFLLTSHAGTPVAVWDRRLMNGPVHEVQHLPWQDMEQLQLGGLPMQTVELHERPASQALHLSCTSDLLLGRADNGYCWLFDLSECLGWADGSHAGSWLRLLPGTAGLGASSHCSSAAGGTLAPGGGWETSEQPCGGCIREDRQGHLDEHDLERAPAPLGFVGAPYEVWCSTEGEAQPLHWLPTDVAWVAHNRLLLLGGLELEQKQHLFPAHAQGSPYPSNVLVVASLQPRQA